MSERRSKRANHAIGFSLALVALLVGVWAVTPFGQSVMPVPRIAFYDNNGNPCAGCRLYAYVAGTTTPQATYTDSALSVPNTNPVILDSAGRATVFLNNTLNYKFTLSTAADAPIWTVDNITGQLANIVTVTAANTRGLQITRSNAESGLSIASVGGSGKTYGIASTTAGALVLRDDADGTPNITINASDQIALTATGGVAITGNLLMTGSVTSAWTFATTPKVEGGAPGLDLLETGATANEGRWLLYADGDSLQAVTTNDAGAFGSFVWQVDRTGTTPNTFSVTPTLNVTTALRLTGAITPAALAADQNNYNPTGLASASRVRLSTSGGARTITGLAAQADGFTITILNLGPDIITFASESASSTAANRFMGNGQVATGEFICLIYDATSSRWVLLVGV